MQKNNLIKVPKVQQNLEDNFVKLVNQYKEFKAIRSVDTQDKLLEIADFIKNHTNSLDYLSIDGLDIEVQRLILLQKELTLKDISTDFILSKIPLDQLEIENLGENIGHSIIDQIVLRPFSSLSNKITFFNYAAKNYKKELDKSLIYLLVMAHIADKAFYEHLEKLILQSDDVVYFPEKYSYNPYEGREKILNDAVSHLLNIIINREAKRDNGISYMKELIMKYSSIIKYQHICDTEIKGVPHPIFYLVESRMWEELYQWIKQDKNILMMADPTGNNPLITTILTFAHGSIQGKDKGNEHDALFDLQKLAIQQYISGDMYKMFAGEHKIIEPQIGLFIGYLEYDQAKISKTNKSFMISTKVYYKELIKYFIEIDNNFLKARINGIILPEFKSSEMISLWNLILQSTEISDSPFIVSESHLDAISKEQLIVDLYKGVIVQNKVNEKAEKILDEISNLFKHYTLEDNNTIFYEISDYSPRSNVKPLDQLTIAKDNLIKKMFDDYLKISYLATFKCKAQVSNNLYNTIITAVNNNTFDTKRFIVNQAETFTMICTMGCERLLKTFENRINLQNKSEENHFTEQINIDSTELLKILVPSAITAMWLGHRNNSNKNSYANFLKVADILNTIIRQVGNYIGEPAVLLNIQDNYVSEEKISYISCKLEDIKIQTISSLDLRFIDSKFQLIGNGLGSDYVRIYNFYSAFLAKKLYMENSFEYDHLFNTSELAEVKPIDTPNFINQSYNLARSMINKVKNTVQSHVEDEIKYKVNYYNINKAINILILYLSNRNNQSEIENLEQDEHISQICNLFNIIDRKYPIFQDINDATSDLWENIRMMGSQRTKLLLNFFIDKEYVDDDTHNINCIITRCVKNSLIAKDLDGLKKWLDYSIGRLSSEKEADDINVKGIKNKSQVIAIHDALNIAVMLNIPQGIEVILKKYVNFLILYKNPEIFDKYTILPFAIIREHSKSKMMEVPEFKNSLSKITVMFLENGYPIDLIEKCDDLKASSFIQSLISDQVKYSLKRVALNYTDSLPIPFINHFKEVGKVMLEVKYYLDLYEKSFNFLYGKGHEDKIDISNFCHIFASVLQPEDFLSRLKNITFLTGLKTDFSMTDNSDQLIRQAKNVALIVSNMDNAVIKNFTIRWNGFMENEIMNFEEISQYINKYLIERKDDKVLELIEANEIGEINFFEYLYKKSQIKDINGALYKMKDNNSIKILSQVGASLITGTFILFNNPEMRNTLITVIPTVYSGLTLAISSSSNIISTVSSTAQSFIGSIQDMSYTALYLVLAGATIYAGYKLYQGVNNEKVVKLDLKMFEDLVEALSSKVQTRSLKSLTPEITVYHQISEIFKASTNHELMPCESFFSILERFGITSVELDHAIYNLSHNMQDVDLMDNILSIAYAMSFAAMYINVQKIKNTIDKIDKGYEKKFYILLHDVVTGNVTNIPLAMKDSGLDKVYSGDLNKLTNIGLQVISNHFDCKKTHQYLYIWNKTSNSTLEEVLRKLPEMQESIDSNPFVKFILVLKEQMNNKIQIDKIVNQSLSIS